jgi:hypothetical protein
VGDAICRPKGWAGGVRSVRGRTSLVVVLDMPVCRRARYTNAMAVDPGRSTAAARVICGAPISRKTTSSFWKHKDKTFYAVVSE